MNKIILGLFIVVGITIGGCSGSHASYTQSNEDGVAENKYGVIKTTYIFEGYDAAIAKAESYRGDLSDEYIEKAIEYINIEEGRYSDSYIDSETSQITSDMEVTEFDYRLENGRRYIFGYVKNIGSKTISYYEVIGRLTDDNGDIIDTDYTNSGLDLQPSESRSFELSIKDNNKATGYGVRIDNVVYK